MVYEKVPVLNFIKLYGNIYISDSIQLRDLMRAVFSEELKTKLASYIDLPNFPSESKMNRLQDENMTLAKIRDKAIETGLLEGEFSSAMNNNYSTET